LTNSV